MAGGKAFTDVRQALRDLGLDDPDPDTALRRAGIKLLRLGMIHPIEREKLREFATGVETVLVVEEKSAFVEAAIRDALYGLPDAPAVIGSADAAGAPLVPVAGGAHGGRAGRAAAARARGPGGARPRRAASPSPCRCFRSGARRTSARDARTTARPSCPRARSPAAASAATPWSALTGRRRATVTRITQMGGEGAQWIGQAPYTDVRHMFQNMGDGTFFHSGQLAVQACVAAGVNDHLQAAVQPARSP